MTEFQRSGAPNQETLAWQGLDQVVLRMDESLGFSRPFQAGCTYMLAPKDEVKTMGERLPSAQPPPAAGTPGMSKIQERTHLKTLLSAHLASRVLAQEVCVMS